PLPVSWIVCGVPTALSVTSTRPLTCPEATGENDTSISHVALAGSEAPQLLVTSNPDSAFMPSICKAAEPVFVKLTVWASSVGPAICWPKLMLVAGSSPIGAAPGTVLDQAASSRTPIKVRATKLFIALLPNRQAADGLTSKFTVKGPLDSQVSSVEG